MKTLRIYDLKGNVLSVGLKDLLRLFAPQSLQADWTVSTVKSSRSEHEWFDATGEGGARLEALAQGDQRLSGADLAALAEKTRQVIWGKFTGSAPTQPDRTWVIIRAIDSTYYEIETEDEVVLDKVRSTYSDVRAADARFGSPSSDDPGE